MTELLPDLSGAKILAVDDSPANLDVLIAALEKSAYSVLVATAGERALEIALREKPDLILLDVAMPGMNGFEVCRRLKEGKSIFDIPVVFLTALDEPEQVIAGFGVGAVDYIVKPFRHEEVLARVRTHLEHRFLARALREKNRELIEKTEKLEDEIKQRQALDNRLTMISRREAAHWDVDGIIGQSPTMNKILRDISLLKNANSMSVLIKGESGTGKELVARAIHAGSSRADGPFITVNCATIPNELAESLLFGHRAGAFTGATGDQAGYFEMADGGTLFLDEIGTMPAIVQPKLLRVLEDGYIRPLGAKDDRRVDVRILSATNEPNSAFREDLYFRLARFTVDVPPLRQRKDDIPLLARHFLAMFAAEMGLPTPHFAASALDRLRSYDFSGNVRELKNVVERALIESGGDDILAEHLRIFPPSEAEPVQVTTADGLLETLPFDFAEAETLLVQRAIKHTDGNIAAAARLLGIDRNKVYRKLGAEKGSR